MNLKCSFQASTIKIKEIKTSFNLLKATPQPIERFDLLQMQLKVYPIFLKDLKKRKKQKKHKNLQKRLTINQKKRLNQKKRKILSPKNK
jgi:hypothetical protein